MKRIRITAALMISASLALASVGAQAASTDLSADVVVFVDGGANGTVVLTGTIDLEDRLQNAEATQVRAIIAPAGELDLVDPIDLLDPRNRPDCDCLLIGDFAPFQDVPGSLQGYDVFHSAWMLGDPEFSSNLQISDAPRSSRTGSVSLSSWLLSGDDGQPNS